MSILVDVDILNLVETAGLIANFDRSSLEGASYDMRMGTQFIKHGVVETLTPDKPTLVLAPGEFAILRTHEELNMPTDLVGHNGIMSPWAKRGLVSLFSPQIDPGFCGFLVVPVFNAGDLPVSINLMQRIFTVEFVRTSQAASFGWSQKRGRQDRLEVPVSPSHIRPNLSDVAVMQGKIAEFENKLRDIDKELHIVRARVSDQRERRNFQVNNKMLKYTMVILFLTVLAVLIGILASDYLRKTIWEEFFGTSRAPSQVSPPVDREVPLKPTSQPPTAQ